MTRPPLAGPRLRGWRVLVIPARMLIAAEACRRKPLPEVPLVAASGFTLFRDCCSASTAMVSVSGRVGPED